MKSHRRRDLTTILRSGKATSQSDIVASLRERGHDVTQATVSRDLSAIGATKVRVDGSWRYRLPDEIPRSERGDLVSRSLYATIADFAIAVESADCLVIVHTAPGHAAAVARAIDLAAVEEVVGTVAGDDTIFVATRSPKDAASIAQRWSSPELVG